ncbi:MAG TPA: type II toxin-antitoxin system HipA family toxin [Paraburkholderia sp.]|jgi:serine/threonine-protein kinase HipA
MKKLSVIYVGWGERFELGQLADDGAQLVFEYSAAALQRGLELSPLTLRLRQPGYAEFPPYQYRLPGLIADALPDGWGLVLQDKLFRAKGWNPARMSPLDRLAFVGDRAMGAFVFEPSEPETLDRADVELLGLAREVREALSDGSLEMLRELAVLGGSPQGARPKVLVNYDRATGRIANSEEAPGVPWLVKFQAGNEHKEVCAIEALYAVLARECGLEVPDTQHFGLDAKLAAFGIARFDREGGMRVPVQTVAGALNADFRIPSSVDYTSMLRLTRFLTRDEREVTKAFARCVFNVVFNNRDDHAKNLSYRLSQAGQWQLSPAYDLTFCEGPGGEHQMDVCGEGLAPAKQHLLKLAEQTGVKKAGAQRVIERTAQVAATFRKAAKDFAIRRTTVATIAAHIEANRARMS